MSDITYPADAPGRWPTLTAEKRDELRGDAYDAMHMLQRVASAVTVYPGGGIPAHNAREAAKTAERVVVWMDEQTDAPYAKS